MKGFRDFFYNKINIFIKKILNNLKEPYIQEIEIFVLEF
jgi:hypothetical protein